MKVNAKRVTSRLRELYELGSQTDGNHSRIAFSEEDRKGRALFAGWARELGMSVRADEAGNLIARMAGKDDSLPAVGMGSHLDTVPDGGALDGALGCVGALEVCEVFMENGYTPNRPIEIIVFSDEEGVRFGDGLFGSGLLCGRRTGIDYSETDMEGTPRSEVMAGYCDGFDKIEGVGTELTSSLECFIELHIEQGAKLYGKGLSIGVVSSIAGVSRSEFTVKGEANHAGSTAMRDRRDALVTSADIIAKVPHIVAEIGSDCTVATVGEIKNSPNSINVIPGVCSFTLEIRDQEEEVMDRVKAAIIAEARKICAENGTELGDAKISYSKPEPMSERVTAILEEAAKALGYDYIKLPSGAFHDSLMMCSVCPTGMIFVPSVKGISHSRFEHTEDEDIERGCGALLEAVRLIDKRGGI